MRVVTTKENTYGFEIEFCTHDNTLLRYTHIEIATIMLKGDAFETGNTIPLKIETDSGDVLELVTPPIIFSNIGNAKKFRDELANYLKGSVKTPLTFKEWWDTYRVALIQNMGKWYAEIERGSVALIEANGNWDLIPFNELQLNISVNNIDDGVNIAAANYRKSKITGDLDWKQYLAQTVLCESTKDWPIGYSTQLSLPMSVQDYVKYVIGHKFLRSTSNIIRLLHLLQEKPRGKSPEIDPTLEWSQVERWLTTWFWGGIIFDIFVLYCDKLGLVTGELTWIHNYSRLTLSDPPAPYTQWSKKLSALVDQGLGTPDVSITNEQAALFIIVQKTLTGTLGKLSEQAQLQKQKNAQESMNPSTMDMREHVNRTDTGEYYWCEYHSSMKDLLGVWFKGHLADVLFYCFHSWNQDDVYNLLAKNLDKLRSQIQDIYIKRLSLANKILDHHIKEVYPEFAFIADDNKLDILITSHDQVINKTAEFVSSGNNTWANIERKQEFLEYSSDNTVWEGRKDTLIGPIEHLNEAMNQNETFFLVEHRNN